MEKRKDFVRVYRLLVGAAETRQTVTYGDVAAIMGLPPQGSHMGRVTGQVLGAIVLREQACGRSMLPAVAVSSTDGMPGAGFYGLAEEQGLLSPAASKVERVAFWRSELERVYTEWSH
jgi:hypothetical protein